MKCQTYLLLYVSRHHTYLGDNVTIHEVVFNWMFELDVHVDEPRDRTLWRRRSRGRPRLVIHYKVILFDSFIC